MDKKKILDKFKKGKHSNLLTLQNNANVIGMEVDENNKLWYVIKDAQGIKLERGKGQKIKNVLWRNERTTTTVKLKNSTDSFS